MAAFPLVLGLLAATAQGKGRLREFEEPLRTGRDSDTSDSRREQDQDPHRGHRAHEPYFQHQEWPSSRDEADCEDILLYPCVDHGLRFDDYPYARHRRFFLTQDSSGRDWSLDLRPYAIRLEHDLLAFGLTGTARYASGGDFRLDFVEYREDVGGRTDRLTLQTYEVNYGPGLGPRSYHWTFGWGVAVLEGEETHAGLSIQGAADWFPAPPISLRAHAAWLIFSRSTMADLQAEARLHWNRFALGLGFRSLVNSVGDSLTGPFVSLTVWF